MADATTTPDGDHGEAEVQTKADVETDQGYHGTKVDPVPNEAYTLTTGPDSPPVHPDDCTRTGQHSTTRKAS